MNAPEVSPHAEETGRRTCASCACRYSEQSAGQQTTPLRRGVHLQALVDRLKRKAYRARLVRRHYIPKGNGKLRPLGIPVLEDKLVQHAAKRILEAIYEADFIEYSFAYRPERSAKDAVNELCFRLQFAPVCSKTFTPLPIRVRERRKEE